MASQWARETYSTEWTGQPGNGAYNYYEVVFYFAAFAYSNEYTQIYKYVCLSMWFGRMVVVAATTAVACHIMLLYLWKRQRDCGQCQVNKFRWMCNAVRLAIAVAVAAAGYCGNGKSFCCQYWIIALLLASIVSFWKFALKFAIKSSSVSPHSLLHSKSHFEI